MNQDRRSGLRDHDELVLNLLNQINDKLVAIEKQVQNNRVEIATVKTRMTVYASLTGLIGGLISGMVAVLGTLGLLRK